MEFSMDLCRGQCVFYRRGRIKFFTAEGKYQEHKINDAAGKFSHGNLIYSITNPAVETSNITTGVDKMTIIFRQVRLISPENTKKWLKTSKLATLQHLLPGRFKGGRCAFTH
jgi:hypothetical protein